MYTSEKNTNELTVRGGVNPYGQPDRKISGFFFDDFPQLWIETLKQKYKYFKAVICNFYIENI